MAGEWSLPGRQADPARWNLDPKTGWVPPGQTADKSRMQYTLPHGVSPSAAPNWHMLMSPAGTPAPRDALNYTKSAGISPVGTQAPVGKTNFSMLPAGAAAPTPPTGSSPNPAGSGVGAGQADDGSGTTPWWDTSGSSGSTDPTIDPNTGGVDANGQPASEGPQPVTPSPANANQGNTTTTTTTRSTTDPYGGNSTSNTTTTKVSPDRTHSLKFGSGGEAYITDDNGEWVRAPSLDDPKKANSSDTLKPHNNPDGTVTWYNSTGPAYTTGSPKGANPSTTHPLTRNDPGYIDSNGNWQVNPGYDPTQPASHTTALNRNSPGYIDGNGNYIPNPGYAPDVSVAAGNTLVNPTTGQVDYQSPQPPTYLSPGQSEVDPNTGKVIATAPQAPIVQQIGNQLLQIDPNTGEVKTLQTVPSQMQTQSVAGPGGEETVFGVDPYTGQTTSLFHQTGGPYEVGHEIYAPSDWTGDTTSYDLGGHKFSQVHHQGTPWTPPPGMRSNAAASAPQPQSAPPPQQPAAALAAGMAGTPQDPSIGPVPPGAYPTIPADPNYRSPVQYDTTPVPVPGLTPFTQSDQPEGSSRGNVDIGSGQGEPQADPSQGAAPGQPGGMPWTPPIDPAQVVGTGHKFGEPVSIEGIHKGVDLQAYRGTPAKSPVDGVVVRVEHNPKGLGITVTIRDAQGHEHTLGHLGSVSVKPGDKVRAGQPVASVGSTGASTGPHLDVREKSANGAPVDVTPKLGPLAQMPRADNGSEPQGPGQIGQGQAGGVWSPPFGRGQDVGVGGVYVKEPDGSMHWDETKADPNPNGGSVLDSSGNVIPGANRQSGPTGPGGTGPPGSQARSAHVSELDANPTFRSGTSGILDMWSGASPNGDNAFNWNQSPGMMGATGNNSGLLGSLPSLRSTPPAAGPGSPLDNPWLYSNTGAGQDTGVGALDPNSVTNPSPNFKIAPPSGSTGNMDPYDAAYIDYLFQQLQSQSQASAQQLQAQIAAENDRHQEAMASAVTAQQQEQENARHNSATEQLTAAEDNLNASVSLVTAGLQSGTQIGLQNAQIAAQYGLQSQQLQNQTNLQNAQTAAQFGQSAQQFQQGVVNSALQAPWLQELQGMAPSYGQPGGPGGSSTPVNVGNNLSFSQILQNASNPNPTPGSMAGPTPSAGAIPQTSMPNFTMPSLNLPSNWQGTSGGSNPYLSGSSTNNNIMMDAWNTKAGGQQAIYLQTYGGNVQEAATHWWNDMQGAIAAAGMTPDQWVYGPSGAPSSGAFQGTPNNQQLTPSAGGPYQQTPGGPSMAQGSPSGQTSNAPFQGTPNYWEQLGGSGGGVGPTNPNGGAGPANTLGGNLIPQTPSDPNTPQGGTTPSTNPTGSMPQFQPFNMSYSDFSSMSPFQQGAWQSALMAEGPGAYQTEQNYLTNQWGQQGITGPSDTTQLAWDTGGPMGQMQQGNQASFFGQTPSNWLGTQGSTWAKSAQPQVGALT